MMKLFNFMYLPYFHVILSILAVCASSLPIYAFAMPSSQDSMWEAQRRSVPHAAKSPIIIGYAHNVKSGKAERAIQDGAAVIIWSFFHFEMSNVDQKGNIRTTLDLDEISSLRNKYSHVVHLGAFGGWNGPHPPDSLNGRQWCDVFMQFNEEHGFIFDGVDWDYEGHDNLDAPTATFTLQTLDIMADFSVYAKSRYRMIVSMAPAESYLDAMADEGSSDAAFSLRLDFPPRAWTSSTYATDDDRKLIESVGFSHAGRQCYSYVLAKAGIDTFDWVSIQLYEAYSPFAHELSGAKANTVASLRYRVSWLAHGYTVSELPTRGSSISELPALASSEYKVQITLSKLVSESVINWWMG